MRRVVIALGSNLADPAAAVRTGWRCVVHELGLADARLSTVTRTQPAEGAAGGTFANAVGVAMTGADPLTTLRDLQTIEHAFGRQRTREGVHGARPLDLDLIDHGGVARSDIELTLPHPRVARRRFVLQPLAELLPTWHHPRSGRGVLELLAALVLLVGVAGCHHEPPPSSPWQSTLVAGPPPPLVLNVAPVTDSAMLNTFCDALATYEGRALTADILMTSAGRFTVPVLADNAGARLIAAHAVYRAVQAQALSKRFKDIRQLVDNLVKAAPTAAETRFALAYLRWILVTADADFGRRPRDRGVIEDLVTNLERLSTDYPRFDGPGDFDRERIRSELAAMKLRLSRPVDLPDDATGAALPSAATASSS